MANFVYTETALRGEERTAVNQVINQVIEVKLNPAGYECSKINVNGAIRTNKNPFQIADWFEQIKSNHPLLNQVKFSAEPF